VLTVNPKDISVAKMHAYMLGAIAPRPIAFASTIDKDGNPNLSPFSFFNAFGSHPPLVVFSPARRVRDNTTKHTLENVREVKEVVINSVNYAMVQQTSLASCEYPKGTNEFAKAGFTPIPSELVKPFRVKESPVQMECKVLQVIETGQEGGAANLIICEILLMHINEDVLNQDGRIDQNKIDLVARMGGDMYCRASGNAIFEVPKPNTKLGVGIDNIPDAIRHSEILSGNDLGKLGNADSLPSPEDIKAYWQIAEMRNLLLRYGSNHDEMQKQIHLYAKELLLMGNVADAWKILLGPL
jgi:flavin reductase (DIM6/NTAB) family NADH-FMN oxidoreductase RutF